MGVAYGTGVILVFHNWILGLSLFAPSVAVWGLHGLFALYLGLFFGLGTGLGWWLCQRGKWGWVHMGFSWALGDMLRTMGPIGTPSGSLAYAVVFPWNQVASVVGASGVMMLLALCQAMLAHTWLTGGRARWMGISVFIMGMGTWAWWGIHTPLDRSVTAKIQIGLVQPNHAQQSKLNEPDAILLRDALELSNPLINRVSLIIWPETALLTPLSPSFPVHVLQHLSPLLLGLPTIQGPHTMNSMVLIQPTQTVVVYNKQRLMPFGEYWPMASWVSQINGLEWVGQSFSAGDILPPFQTMGMEGRPIQWGGAICLEAIYPWVTRRGVKDGATAIVMVANNAWFQGYPAGIQLIDMARMRAIETQREIVFSSNSGPSGVIRRNGEIELGVSMGERGTSIHMVRGYSGLSWYIKMGDTIWWAMIVVWVLVWMQGWLKRGQKKNPEGGGSKKSNNLRFVNQKNREYRGVSP